MCAWHRWASVEYIICSYQKRPKSNLCVLLKDSISFWEHKKVKKTKAIIIQTDHDRLEFFVLCRKCEMDEASEDSRPAQPGFVKKFFVTISQVMVQKCQFLQVQTLYFRSPRFSTFTKPWKNYHPAYMYKCINRPKFCSLTRLSDSSIDFKECIN